MALDGATGEILGNTPSLPKRDGPLRLWAHGGKEELVVLGNGRAYGYDLQEGKELWYVNGFPAKPSPFPSWMRVTLPVSSSAGRGRRWSSIRPFWSSLLTFDQDQDGRISKEEITDLFTLPIRPELPIEHPGFGIPSPRTLNNVENVRQICSDGVIVRTGF